MKTFEQLTDGETERFRAELVPLIGEGPANAGSMLRRFVLGDQGELLLEWREPEVKRIPHPDVPWAEEFEHPRQTPEPFRLTNAGMRVTVKRGPLPDVVAILAAPDNPEIEVERRARLWGAAVEAERVRVENERLAEVAQRQAKAEHKRRRPDRWAALPREQQAIYLAADAADGVSAKRALQLLAGILGHKGSLTGDPPQPAESFEPDLA